MWVRHCVPAPGSSGVILNNRVRDRDDRGGGVRRHPVHRRDGRLDRQRVDQHHQSRAEHQRLGDESGGATIEAAFGVAGLVVVLLVCVSGLA